MRHVETAAAAQVGLAAVADPVATVHMEALVGGRAVAVVFVIRRHVVEVCCAGSVTATIARADLQAWFSGSVRDLEVPELTLTVPAPGEVSITLPSIDRWMLSPADRTRLREAVCRELVDISARVHGASLDPASSLARSAALPSTPTSSGSPEAAVRSAAQAAARHNSALRVG